MSQIHCSFKYTNKLNVFVQSFQIITPLPSHIPQCKALYDFRMTNDDEDGCLTFNKVLLHFIDC